MDLETISDHMYELMIERIGSEKGYETFLTKGVVNVEGEPAFANVKGEFFVTASFMGIFTKSNKPKIEKFWYQDHRIDPIEENDDYIGVPLKKQMRLYHLSPRQVYKLNKETVKKYYGVV